MNSLEEIALVFSLAMSLISMFSVLYLAGVKLGKLEVKVDTLWDFQLRRGLSEGAAKGLVTINSPVEISEQARSLMRVMARDLHAFYRRLGRNLSDRELAIEIERHFGDRILREICIPNGLYHAFCLNIAVEIAKEIAN